MYAALPGAGVNAEMFRWVLVDDGVLANGIAESVGIAVGKACDAAEDFVFRTPRILVLDENHRVVANLPMPPCGEEDIPTTRGLQR